jgi:glycosyltransferase involved in cell wall biosynthesis
VRILFIRNLYHPRDFGGNRYPYEVTRRLAERGHEIRVVTGSKTRTADAPRGLRIMHYPASQSHPLMTFWSNALGSRAAAALASMGWRPDVVVLSSYDASFGHGLPRWSRHPATVFIYHSRFQSDAVDRFLSSSSPPARMFGPSLKGFVTTVQTLPLIEADTVIAVSEYSKREIEAFAPGRHDPPVVIPTGVDLTKFHPGNRESARDKLGLPRNASVLLVVGRLVPVKRFDRAMEVLRQLRAQGDVNWHLLVVGDGPEAQRLRDVSTSAGIGAFVRFEGHRTGEDLLARYQAADLQLCTSEFENWSLSLLEGLASGNAIVGTPTGGTPDLLAQVDPDMVMADERPDTMAAAIRDLAGASGRLDAMRHKAVRVAQRYSWDAVVGRLEDELAKLVAPSR